jgi:hypothetical protein
MDERMTVHSYDFYVHNDDENQTNKDENTIEAK